MSIHVAIDREKIVNFCRKWKITEFALFGSVLRDDFRSDSDVDVLVTFAPNTKRSIHEWVDIYDELENIFGRTVDVIEKKAVEESENYIRKDHILSFNEVIYVAG